MIALITIPAILILIGLYRLRAASHRNPYL
jgi:hypothetical protein